jgi:hypothetical protein
MAVAESKRKKEKKNNKIYDDVQLITICTLMNVWALKEGKCSEASGLLHIFQAIKMKR